jgi:hypothetical protein
MLHRLHLPRGYIRQGLATFRPILKCPLLPQPRPASSRSEIVARCQEQTSSGYSIRPSAIAWALRPPSG